MTAKYSDFVATGFTIISYVPEEIFIDTKDYHPAMTGNINPNDYGLDSTHDVINDELVFSIPIARNGKWTKKHIDLFSKVKLKQVIGKDYLEATLNLGNLSANLILKIFQLHKVAYAGKLVFMATLFWYDKSDTTKLIGSSRWFWIPD